MRDRFGVYRNKSGFWVIDRKSGRVVVQSPHESAASQFCAEANELAGGPAIAPGIDCLMCYGLGFVTDPDKQHPSLRCNCAAGRAA